jgi:hypothetical protein
MDMLAIFAVLVAVAMLAGTIYEGFVLKAWPTEMANRFFAYSAFLVIVLLLTSI